MQQGSVAISGTHNCCFCCWSLAEALSQSKSGLDVILTGTHGIIRPWNFPDVGLSIEEAKLNDLETILMERLRAECASRRDLHLQDQNGSKGHHRSGKRFLSHLSFGLFG